MTDSLGNLPQSRFQRIKQRKLGILGGMSWVSTAHYYEGINRGVNSQRGRQHSAEILLASVDFQTIVDAQVRNDWQAIASNLVERALELQQAGAQAVMIASNTIHLVADSIASTLGVPLINIIDSTSEAIRGHGAKRVGFLGTRYAMGMPYFAEEYAKRGIELVFPSPDDARRINDIIFHELIHGQIRKESQIFYREVATNLCLRGVDGVVLGCTEIGLLLRSDQVDFPVYDTTTIHVAAGVRWLLADS